MQRSFLLFACLVTCVAVAQQYPFVYYTPKDGLVNSRVRRIKQDAEGRMHFITYGGLSVYDGARFINYRKDNGLAHDLVNDVIEAAPDSFLIATNAPPLNTLVRGKTGVYKTADGFYPLVNRFLKSRNGQLYVTADEGLFVLQKACFHKLPLLTAEGKDIGHTLDGIVEWKDFLLIMPWSNVGYSLMAYNLRTGKLAAAYKKPLSGIAVDAQERIWLSTAKGLTLLDTALFARGEMTEQPLPATYTAVAQQPHNAVYFDRENDGWFYSGNRVQRLSSGSALQSFSVEQGLKSGSIVDVFRDREGIVWMATNGAGVVKLNSTTVRLMNRLPSGAALSATALQQQGDTVWLFNAADNKVYRLYKNECTSFPLTGFRLPAASLLPGGPQLYISDAEKLIVIANKNKAAAYHSPPVFWKAGNGESLGAGIAMPDGAIVQYIIKGDSVFVLTVFKDGKEVMRYPIPYATDQLSLDAKGRLWVATRNAHLFLFTLHPQTPERYLQLKREWSTELPAGIAPRSLATDKEGKVWVGTRYNGVYLFTFDDDSLSSVRQFTTKDGLTDNFVYRLYCDADNTVWIGTQTGLDKLVQKDGRYLISNISKTYNYFQSIWQIAGTGNGELWALTSEGTVLNVATGKRKTTVAPPPLLLTSLKVANREAAAGAANFSYSENNLSFEVAAPSFVDEKSIRYRYKLQGSGNDAWSEPSNTATFNAVNLSPGNYTLWAIAEFPEALYPPQQLLYAFRIHPPWWQRWWAKTGAGLLMLVLLVTLIRLYYRRKLQRQKIVLEKRQAIEKERTRIATDMHDDLGATLSRIKFLSEGIAAKKGHGALIDEDVSRIKNYSYEMIGRMGEIVWALNEKNDSLDDLLSYTRAYAMEYLSEHDIQCKVEAPSDVPPLFVSGEVRRNVFLSVKEALHNVVKHAAATEVLLSVTVGKELRIVLRDNGKGFPAATKQGGNGMASIANRMVSIGGKADVSSTDGTAVYLSAPLHR